MSKTDKELLASSRANAIYMTLVIVGGLVLNLFLIALLEGVG